VRAVAEQAIEAARRGEGPRLIEALTYRLADHTTTDDASRYRDPAEVTGRWAEDPLARLRTLLVNERGWNRDREEAAIHEADAAVEAAVAQYLATPAQQAETMFDYVYETVPPDLAAQRGRLGERHR